MSLSWLDWAGYLMPWVVVVWAAHRAHYMSSRTPLVDRLSIVAIGGGALGFALAPVLGSWDSWREPLLWAGIIGWCVTPTMRHSRARRQS
jgi:hypothetical protein